MRDRSTAYDRNRTPHSTGPYNKCIPQTQNPVNPKWWSPGQLYIKTGERDTLRKQLQKEKKPEVAREKQILVFESFVFVVVVYILLCVMERKRFACGMRSEGERHVMAIRETVGSGPSGGGKCDGGGGGGLGGGGGGSGRSWGEGYWERLGC